MPSCDLAKTCYLIKILISKHVERILIIISETINLVDLRRDMKEVP